MIMSRSLVFSQHNSTLRIRSFDGSIALLLIHITRVEIIRKFSTLPRFIHATFWCNWACE